MDRKERRELDNWITREEPDLADDIIRLGDALALAVNDYLDACDHGATEEAMDAYRERMRAARLKYVGEDR